MISRRTWLAAWAAGVAPVRTPRRVWAGEQVSHLGAPSPDGRFVTLVEHARGDLAVRFTQSGTVKKVTSNPEGSPEFAYFSTVSPDSKQIAYAWFNRDKFYELRVANVESGEPRTLHRNEERRFVQPCAWSRDGKQILTLFFRNDNVSQIALVNAADGGVKVLKSLDWVYPNKMDISPDGKWIAYDDLLKEGEPARGIFLLAADGTSKRALLRAPMNDLFPLFAPDGKALTFLRTTGNSADLAVCSLDGGEPRLLARNMGRALPLGITRAGDYYYALRKGEATLVVATPEGKRTEVASGAEAPAWSPDGTQLAFLTRAPNENFGQESRVIAVVDLNSGRRRVLAPRLAVLDRICWSPQGKWFLAGGSDRHGQRGLYLIDAESAAVRPVVREDAATYEGFEGVWIEGGKAVCYNNGTAIRIRPLEGDGEREVHRVGPGAKLHDLCVSPDQKWIGCAVRLGEAESLFVLPLAGGMRQVASIKRGGVSGLEFTRESNALLASVPSDPPAVWQVSLDGGQPQKLAWQLGQQGAIRLQPNGNRIAFSTGRTQTEIWIVERLMDASYHQR